MDILECSQEYICDYISLTDLQYLVSPQAHAYSISGCWPLEQCQAWDPSCQMDLKSNQAMVGFSLMILFLVKFCFQFEMFSLFHSSVYVFSDVINGLMRSSSVKNQHLQYHRGRVWLQLDLVSTMPVRHRDISGRLSMSAAEYLIFLRTQENFSVPGVGGECQVPRLLFRILNVVYMGNTSQHERIKLAT